MTAAEILVIFLSVALAIFLVLGIILVIYLIAVARKIRRVADSAERAVGNIEGIFSLARKAAAPAMVSQFVMETVARFMKRKSRNKKEEE